MKGLPSGQAEGQLLQEGETTLVVQIQPVPCKGGTPFGEAFESCFTTVNRVARRYGGRVKWLDEDKIVCQFSRGTTACQGVEAAFQVMEALTALNQNRLSLVQTPIRVGIGVNSRQGSACPVAKARALSELNRQTPFPAIFVSAETMEAMKQATGRYFVQALATPSSRTPGDLYALLPARLVP